MRADNQSSPSPSHLTSDGVGLHKVIVAYTHYSRVIESILGVVGVATPRFWAEGRGGRKGPRGSWGSWTGHEILL